MSEPKPRKLVVCCDGTGNDIASDSTNVLRLYRSLVRSEDQVAYYDSGVGTLADPMLITRIGRRISKKLDGAIGRSIRDNVCQAYAWLAQHYRPGDQIYLFGFSRGAYTVRAIAGMIRFLGLVRPELEGLAPLAWTVFADEDKDLPTRQRFGGGNRFRSAFAVEKETPIHFIGVWDTVSAFGFLLHLKTLPYTQRNEYVRHVRHAVAIDERRSCFPVDLYPDDVAKEHDTFKQRWFAGVHSDVGGGYPEKDSGLAKHALAWMYDEARSQGCLLQGEMVAKFLGESSGSRRKAVPDPLAKVHNSMEGMWHLLEFLPQRRWHSEGSDDKGRMKLFGPNLYRRRKIPEGAVLSLAVKQRQEETGYHPCNLPKDYTFAD